MSRRMSLRQRAQHLRAGVTGSAGHLHPDNPEMWSSWDGIPVRDNQVRVSAQTVAQIPEAYACLLVISQAAAGLPLITYERKGNSKERADRHPIAALLRHRPNPVQTAFEWRAQMTWDLLLHRNAYSEIKDGPRGPIDSLTRLDPERLIIIIDGADYVYEYAEDLGSKGTRVRRLDPEQVFHLRAPPLTSNNLLGRSLIKDGQRTFARALAIQQFAQDFFENDATPGSVITTAASFKTQELADQFRARWQRMFGQAKKRGVPAVLDGTTKFETVNIQNDKAQFIETYKEVALQILRLWRMPPHKVGILDKATFSNIEQQSLEFVMDTLMPWLVAWEQGIRRDLLLNPERFYAEHNVAGLLRGDLKARYEAYAIGRNWGWLSVNDVRSLENLNPVSDGDVYLQPLNMVPAGSQVAERAAFDAWIDREAAVMRGLEQLKAQRLIAHEAKVEETP